MREESWQLLAEAIRENDRELLQRHSKLWENSEMLMVSGMKLKLELLLRFTT